MAAPKISTSAPSAQVWAKDTANTLNSDPREPREPDDTPARSESKSGQDFPGAFPPSSEKERVLAQDRSVGEPKPAEGGLIDSASHALETAKGYLPESVQGYLPGGVAHKPHNTEEHHTSLPSEEIHGDTSGKSGGVGSLPGDFDESAVALLPDEKNRAKPALGLGSAEVERAPGRFGEPIYHRTSVTAKDNKIQDLPPHEEGGSPVHTLPAAAVKESPTHAVGGQTAVTDKKETEMTNAPAHESPTVNTASLSQPTSTKHDEAVAAAIPSKSSRGKDEKSNGRGRSGTHDINTRSAGAAVAKDGKSVDPAATAADQPKVNTEPHIVTSVPKESAALLDTPTSAAPLQSHESPVSSTSPQKSASETSNGTKKKAGFLDKLKGEAKVLSGKMSHDEKKVEEGKRMMGKSV